MLSLMQGRSYDYNFNTCYAAMRLNKESNHLLRHACEQYVSVTHKLMVAVPHVSGCPESVWEGK